MKRKFKQWWSTIPLSSTKWTNVHLKSLNTKKTTTYDVRNPGHGMWQAQKCGWVKPFNGIPSLPVLILGSPHGNKYNKPAKDTDRSLHKWHTTIYCEIVINHGDLIFVDFMSQPINEFEIPLTKTATINNTFLYFDIFIFEIRKERYQRGNHKP